MSLRGAISSAYNISHTRIVMDDVLGNTLYDFLLSVPKESAASLERFLQQALETTFNIQVRRETREATVYVLLAPNGQPPARHTASTGGMMRSGPGKLTSISTPLSFLAATLEGFLKRPVVDETQLAGKYDFEMIWDAKKPESIIVAVREQLGLELREARRPVEILVVEAAPAAPKPAAEKATAPHN